MGLSPSKNGVSHTEGGGLSHTEGTGVTQTVFDTVEGPLDKQWSFHTRGNGRTTEEGPPIRLMQTSRRHQLHERHSQIEG